MTARLGRVLRTRTAMASWVGLWVVAGGVLVAWSARGGEERPPLGSTEARIAASKVDVTIQSVTTTSAATIVEFTVDGRPELGGRITSSAAGIVDAEGAYHSGDVVWRDGRHVIQAVNHRIAPGRARLEPGILGLTNDPLLLHTERPALVTYVSAAPVSIEVGGIPEPDQQGSGHVSRLGAADGYPAVVGTVVRDDFVLVISGMVEPTSAATEIQAARLVLDDGSRLTPVLSAPRTAPDTIDFRFTFSLPAGARWPTELELSLSGTSLLIPRTAGSESPPQTVDIVASIRVAPPVASEGGAP